MPSRERHSAPGGRGVVRTRRWVGGFACARVHVCVRARAQGGSVVASGSSACGRGEDGGAVRGAVGPSEPACRSRDLLRSHALSTRSLMNSIRAPARAGFFGPSVHVGAPGCGADLRDHAVFVHEFAPRDEVLSRLFLCWRRGCFLSPCVCVGVCLFVGVCLHVFAWALKRCALQCDGKRQGHRDKYSRCVCAAARWRAVIAVVAAGAIVFKDFVASRKAIVGLALSFAGTAWFSGLKLLGHNRSSRPAVGTPRSASAV